MTVQALRLVLGDQLSFELAALQHLDPLHDCVLLAEVAEEARHVPHHPQKIAFIFSAMRHFAQALRQRGVRVAYVALNDPANTGSLAGELQRFVQDLCPQSIHVTEAGDWRVEQALNATGLPITWHADTRFICSRDEFARWAAGRKSLRMEFFYREMRRKTRLLLDANGAPEGGAWNFDADNRKPLPKNVRGPLVAHFPPDALTSEVLALVAEQFGTHYGSLSNMDYPVTAHEAEQLWQHFLAFALPAFGDYQDAMAQGEPFLFHSRISAALNIGLLDVRRLCADVEAAYRAGTVPLNAAEGFIRQLIGWREYVRGIYWLKMPEYAHSNQFNNKRTLPDFYWTAKTRMNCMQQSIQQTIDYAYAHHIQRLMVTGNFALLAGIKPQAISDWYLAVYMDAFEWVELPNVIGMVMHADAGYLGSKPYCASGQYIKRMSNYCENCAYNVRESTSERACPFNALYWHFLMRHRTLLAANPRLAMVYRTLDAMPEAKQQALWQRAETWLSRLDAGETV